MAENSALQKRDLITESSADHARMQFESIVHALNASHQGPYSIVNRRGEQVGVAMGNGEYMIHCEIIRLLSHTDELRLVLQRSHEAKHGLLDESFSLEAFFPEEIKQYA